jgi:RNA polymerase sigma factor (TIGR02999 family)
MRAMSEEQPGEVTLLLRRLQSGDRPALDRLMELIYPELRRIAHAYWRQEPRERVLQPTALVNEAYLRLVAQHEHNWRNRAHFFGAAAGLMRRILIERARARLAAKRTGEAVPLEDAWGLSSQRSVEILAIEDALSELTKVSPRQAQVVEMRYFGGLTVEESAEALNTTSRTVERDWAVARAWLRRYLEQP